MKLEVAETNGADESLQDKGLTRDQTENQQTLFEHTSMAFEQQTHHESHQLRTLTNGTYKTDNSVQLNSSLATSKDNSFLEDTSKLNF